MKRMRIAFGILAGLLLVLAALVVRRDIPTAEVDARYATPASKFTSLPDGTRMHYWDRGLRNAPVLVLVHGSYDCANTWEAWAPRLEHDFRLIVPDMPGHGLTGRTPADDYTIEAMVRALHALLQQLGLARVHLGGNSMGGNISWRYALDYPAEVERMVLIDSAGYPGVESSGPRATNPAMHWLMLHGNPGPVLRSGFEKAILQHALVSDARLTRWSWFMRREGTREAQFRRISQRNINGQPSERIAQITQPTLILWGAGDRLIPVAHAQRYAHDLPHHRLIIYPGIGHMAQLELPDRSANDARAFLLAAAP